MKESGLNFRLHFTGVLATIVLALSIYEYTRPTVPFRIGPGTLLLIALLLGLRYALRLQVARKASKTGDAPPKPLGLD